MGSTEAHNNTQIGVQRTDANLGHRTNGVAELMAKLQGACIMKMTGLRFLSGCAPFLIGVIALLNPGVARGKRLPPPSVAPVVHHGIEYSAHGDGKVGSVVATDLSSGKELWRSRVFRVRIHWWKGEENNQWVFISDLKLVGNALIVTNEQNRCYVLGLATRHVKRRPCQ